MVTPRRLLFCAFQPDHYDNKLQSYLTLARACFLKAGSPAKCGFAAFHYLPYAASLDAHGSVQKKKMKLHETAGNEKIKQESLYFLLISSASSLKGFWNSTPVNADNGHIFVSRGTNSHSLLTSATYGHWLSPRITFSQRVTPISSRLRTWVIPTTNDRLN